MNQSDLINFMVAGLGLLCLLGAYFDVEAIQHRKWGGVNPYHGLAWNFTRVTFALFGMIMLIMSFGRLLHRF